VTGDLVPLLIVLVGVPMATITTMLVVLLRATRRTTPPPPAVLPDLAGRQALAAAWHAHARLAALEDRVTDLERRTGLHDRRGGAA
jgi:hypothetical protein